MYNSSGRFVLKTPINTDTIMSSVSTPHEFFNTLLSPAGRLKRERARVARRKAQGVVRKTSVLALRYRKNHQMIVQSSCAKTYIMRSDIP